MSAVASEFLLVSTYLLKHLKEIKRHKSFPELFAYSVMKLTHTFFVSITTSKLNTEVKETYGFSTLYSNASTGMKSIAHYPGITHRKLT
jgi:hypothetical protein